MATFTEHLWYFCSFHFNDNPPTPLHGFFFLSVIPIAQREKLGSGGRCLFQECRRPHPKPCPVTPVGVPSEEDGTRVPLGKCHEAGAGADGEVLRQPECHLPSTRVSPWPRGPPRDTNAPSGALGALQTP